MLFTLDGIVSDVKLIQPLKATEQISVTVFEIVTEFNPDQSQKALRPIVVTPSSMITF